MDRKRIAVLCLAAVLLSGCVQRGVPTPTEQPTTQSTQPTETTPPPTTQPTQPETYPAITEPVLDQIPEPIDPVTKLSCTKWVSFPQLLSLGEGKVAAGRNYYDKKQSSFVSYLQILDVYEDKVLYEISDKATRELVQQRFEDGMILTGDPKTCTYYVYNGTLELVDSFVVPATGGYFSYDRKSYYHIQEDALYRMNTETRNRSRVVLEQDLRVESLVGIHPTEELLVARVYLSDYSDYCGLAIIDAATGRLRLLSDTLKHVWLTGDHFYGIAMNDTAYGYDVYMGTLTGTEVKCLPASQIGTDQMGWSVLPGSHILVRRFAPDEEPRNTTLLDLQDNTMVDLDQYGYIDCTFGTIWLYEEQLIMGFYEEGDYFIPVILDPKAMEFTQGTEPETVEFPELVDLTVIEQTPTLDPSFDGLREQADGLEKTYGITVLIAQETEIPCQAAGRSAALATDLGQLQNALELLEQELAKYPEEFFHTLRNSISGGGLTLCLTGKIEGDLETLGFTRLLRDRYVVGLDITHEELAATLHHELWHAIEMRLSTDTFDTEEWSKCNPEGFQYYEKYDEGYAGFTKWTYAGGAGKDSCFVDSYARINAREDRARIWEAVMTEDANGCMEATALQKKLAIMVKAMEKVFPADGDPLWTEFVG